MQNQVKRAGTPKEIARIYGLNERTLANLRCARRGPRFFHAGRKVLYFLEDVEKWLRARPALTRDPLNCEGHRNRAWTGRARR